MKRRILLFLCLILLSLAPAAQAATQLVILGSGTPVADPERSGPATAVIVNGKPYLVDCGTGIVRRAAAASRTVPALAPRNLDTLFLTHLHSDHTIGLPDLLTTPWILGRQTPLRLYGPKGSANMAEHVQAAYSADNDVRRNGLERLPEAGGTIQVKEIGPGKIYDDGTVRVDALAVPHGAWKQAYAFKFTTPDKTIVISGDTRPSTGMIDFAKGCDILVHEVYLEGLFKEVGRPVPPYHKESHTGTFELAELAKAIKPGKLVLYHLLTWGYPSELLVREIRQAGYEGEVVVPDDLDVF